jgi:ABC-type multidrug transport system fused ATPase/permease subunit
VRETEMREIAATLDLRVQGSRAGITQVFRQLYGILHWAERLQFVRLLAAALCLACLEVVGIGAIMPFMGLLAQPELIQQNRWLHATYQTLGFQSSERFILFAGFTLLGIFIFKNSFGVFVIWLEQRFVWGNLYTLSKRLVAEYLGAPYDYYLTHHTSDLKKNVLAELNNVVAGVMLPSVRLVTHGTVALFILGLLFWNDPLLAVVIIGVLGGTYAAIYLGVRKKLSRIGVERVAANRMRFKVLDEAFAGIKDVKLAGREGYFLDEFGRPLLRFCNYVTTQQLTSQVPRFVIESLAFGGILGIVLYMVGVKDDLSQVIPVASLYAMASYRMLPAMQQIMVALTQLRFNQGALAVIEADLRMAASQHGPDLSISRQRKPLPFASRIQLSGVTYTYPEEETPAISDVSLTIERNAAIALVGPSGAGKSTVADIVMGLLQPERGSLMVDDMPVGPENVRAWQDNIGYVPQQIVLSDTTVASNIAFGVPEAEIDQEAVVEAARMAGIHDFVESGLPQGYRTLLGEQGTRLSGGQKQRIAIARALYHRPSVLILDEATSALDAATEAVVSQAIRGLAGKVTQIIIAHRMATVKDCDEILVFEAGRLRARGSYAELIRSSETFRELAQGAVHTGTVSERD